MRLIKKHFTTILLVLILLTGVSLLLYPTVSDYWNSFHQSRAIASYVEAVAEIDNTDYEKMWQEAVAYNEKLKDNSGRWTPTDEELEEYDQILNISDTGIMGYVEIPKINVSLPIYHGTDEAILQIAIGHIPGSSLPVGGKGTHCVISGHRGLPSAKLFTDLDQMEEGDLFMMRVLDETLTYEVDQIRIVQPEDLSDLEIDEDKDLCTLVTCTPYGINSHRLLVRGHRVENLKEDTIRVTADAQQIDPVMVAPAVAVPLVLLLGIGAWIGGRRRRR
ncbi:class C sortase [Clostridium fessum]|uniref:class C sortase n=1 Tax=Clostridium fessum TaxID=2126740 RepID=UPI002A82D6B0|nr:class C sortase [Clostridium fessum]MDY4929551.1 class C sortase [Clostridium fessum]